MSAQLSARELKAVPREWGELAAGRFARALVSADVQTRAHAAEWLRDEAVSARGSDPDVGIRANFALADLLEAIADSLVGHAERPSDEAPQPMESKALAASNPEFEAAAARADSPYRESYDRALQRLVLMRQLIPAATLRAFEVQWRTREREPIDDAGNEILSDEVRDELRQMADHCGAVAYSPGPMRAVRGVSLTFEQLEEFAARVSLAVWPVAARRPR